MNCMEFAHMVGSGVHPVVVFKKAIEDCEGYAEAAMRARIAGARVMPDGIVEFTMDFTGLDAFNQPFESTNYYDEKRVACLTARQAGFYKPVEVYYLDAGQETPFEVVEARHVSLYEQYLASGVGVDESYVAWLESMVLRSSDNDGERIEVEPYGDGA